MRLFKYFPNYRFLVLIASCFLLLVGCSSKSPESIEIGVALPMNYESYGVAPLNGVKLALEEIGYKIHGKDVDLVVRDDKAEPKRGIDIINEFASMGLQVVIGSAASNVTLAMVPVANRSGILMISPISSSSELTTEGGPLFFRTVPSDPAQSEIIVDWMLESGPKKVGILYVDNSWGRGLADAAQRYFKQAGIAVVRQKVVSDQETDFSSEITAMKLASIEALFCPLYPNSAGLAVRQCFELGLKVPIFGADSWGSQEFIDGAGKYAEGAMFCVPGIYSGEKYNAFVSKYKKQFNKDSNFNAASSYDCMHILAKAIYAVIEAKEKITGSNVGRFLRSVKYDGVTGLTQFDEHGDVIGKAYTKKIIRNGKFDFLIEESR